MKIKIFFHVVAQDNWEELTRVCIGKMKGSELWYEADEIHFLAHYEPTEFRNLQYELKHDKRITWHLFEDSCRTRGENYSNHKIKEICDSTDEEFVLLRLHNKSSNYVNSEEIVRDQSFIWRELIEYWNITRWRVMYSKLEEGYDTAGSDYQDAPWPHYSGNVWWARSSYIRKLPQLTLPKNSHEYAAEADTRGWPPRYESELWVGIANPRYWSANPELTNWDAATRWRHSYEYWYSVPFNNFEK